MARSVLITGGAGFIGCSLARRLLGSHHEVTVLDNLHPQVHTKPGTPADLPEDARLLTGDVTSGGNWETVLRLIKPDTIVHLAAETGTGQSLTQASRHGLVNVVGTTRLTDALVAADHRPEHIVLTSSRAVYGEGAWEDQEGRRFYPGPRSHSMLMAGAWDPSAPDGGPARPLPSRAATTEAHPANVYAATKLAQEHVLGAWTTAMGVSLSVLRLQNVYGPGQALSNPYTGVLALFARLAVTGEPIDVYEDGAIIRDFVYVEDVSAALHSAVERPPASSRTVDIGTSDPITILDSATILSDLAGAPPPRVSGKFRDGDVRAAWCEIGDAGAELGYLPEWDFKRGAHDLLARAAAEVGR